MVILCQLTRFDEQVDIMLRVEILAPDFLALQNAGLLNPPKSRIRDMQQVACLITIIEAIIFWLLNITADVILVETSANSSIDNVLELFFV
jgi:hypothetical protein